MSTKVIIGMIAPMLEQIESIELKQKELKRDFGNLDRSHKSVSDQAVEINRKLADQNAMLGELRGKVETLGDLIVAREGQTKVNVDATTTIQGDVRSARDVTIAGGNVEKE